MRCLIIENNIVTNVVEATEDFAQQQGWLISESGNIGDLWDGALFHKPILQVTLLDAASSAYKSLSQQYEYRVQTLAAGYSQYERESWPVQTAEATAYTADPQAVTPWLDAASAARGIDKAELAARVIAMDTAYRQIHGALTGHRQKLWDQIAAAQTAEDIAAIDVTVGWPA